MKEVSEKEVIQSWRTLLNILHETGYDFMYQNEVDTVAAFIRAKLEIDK